MRTTLSFYFSLFVLLSPLWGEPEEISKPLLRVFPAFRFEECEDWAIRPFICKRCIYQGKRYAQKIFFFEDGPIRVHGCYTEEGGFLEESESERK